MITLCGLIADHARSDIGYGYPFLTGHWLLYSYALRSRMQRHQMLLPALFLIASTCWVLTFILRQTLLAQYSLFVLSVITLTDTSMEIFHHISGQVSKSRKKY